MEVKQYKKWRYGDIRPIQNVTVFLYKDGSQTLAKLTIHNDIMEKVTEEKMHKYLDNIERNLGLS